MELAVVLRELWGHKRSLAVGAVVSFVAALYSVYQIHMGSPWLVKRALQHSSASAQAYVDSSESFVGDATAAVQPIINRAWTFANLMASPGAMDTVGHYAGIPGDEIWSAGPVDPSQQRVAVEPTATKRAYQVAGEALPYRIEFLADPTLPIISIYTEAPTTTQALALANASVVTLSAYVSKQQAEQHIPMAARVVIKSMGPASGGIVNGGIAKKLAVLVFVAVFLGWCLLILVCTRVRANWRRSELLHGQSAWASNGYRTGVAHGRSVAVPSAATDKQRSPAGRARTPATVSISTRAPQRRQ
jgi:hypothetical protein